MHDLQWMNDWQGPMVHVDGVGHLVLTQWIATNVTSTRTLIDIENTNQVVMSGWTWQNVSMSTTSDEVPLFSIVANSSLSWDAMTYESMIGTYVARISAPQIIMQNTSMSGVNVSSAFILTSPSLGLDLSLSDMDCTQSKFSKHIMQVRSEEHRMESTQVNLTSIKWTHSDSLEGHWLAFLGNFSTITLEGTNITWSHMKMKQVMGSDPSPTQISSTWSQISMSQVQLDSFVNIIQGQNNTMEISDANIDQVTSLSPSVVQPLFQCESCDTFVMNRWVVSSCEGNLPPPFYPLPNSTHPDDQCRS